VIGGDEMGRNEVMEGHGREYGYMKDGADDLVQYIHAYIHTYL
jgi:hypothetical protein